MEVRVPALPLGKLRHGEHVHAATHRVSGDRPRVVLPKVKSARDANFGSEKRDAKAKAKSKLMEKDPDMYLAWKVVKLEEKLAKAQAQLQKYKSIIKGQGDNGATPALDTASNPIPDPPATHCARAHGEHDGPALCPPVASHSHRDALREKTRWKATTTVPGHDTGGRVLGGSTVHGSAGRGGNKTMDGSDRWRSHYEKCRKRLQIAVMNVEVLQMILREMGHDMLAFDARPLLENLPPPETNSTLGSHPDPVDVSAMKEKCALDVVDVLRLDAEQEGTIAKPPRDPTPPSGTAGVVVGGRARRRSLGLVAGSTARPAPQFLSLPCSPEHSAEITVSDFDVKGGECESNLQFNVCRPKSPEMDFSSPDGKPPTKDSNAVTIQSESDVVGAAVNIPTTLTPEQQGQGQGRDMASGAVSRSLASGVANSNVDAVTGDHSLTDTNSHTNATRKSPEAPNGPKLVNLNLAAKSCDDEFSKDAGEPCLPRSLNLLQRSVEKCGNVPAIGGVVVWEDVLKCPGGRQWGEMVSRYLKWLRAQTNERIARLQAQVDEERSRRHYCDTCQQLGIASANELGKDVKLILKRLAMEIGFTEGVCSEKETSEGVLRAGNDSMGKNDSGALGTGDEAKILAAAEGVTANPDENASILLGDSKTAETGVSQSAADDICGSARDSPDVLPSKKKRLSHWPSLGELVSQVHRLQKQRSEAQNDNSDSNTRNNNDRTTKSDMGSDPETSASGCEPQKQSRKSRNVCAQCRGLARTATPGVAPQGRPPSAPLTTAASNSLLQMLGDMAKVVVRHSKVLSMELSPQFDLMANVIRTNQGVPGAPLLEVESPRKDPSRRLEENRYWSNGTDTTFGGDSRSLVNRLSGITTVEETSSLSALGVAPALMGRPPAASFDAQKSSDFQSRLTSVTDNQQTVALLAEVTSAMMAWERRYEEIKKERDDNAEKLEMVIGPGTSDVLEVLEKYEIRLEDAKRERDEFEKINMELRHELMEMDSKMTCIRFRALAAVADTSRKYSDLEKRCAFVANTLLIWPDNPMPAAEESDDLFRLPSGPEESWGVRPRKAEYMQITPQDLALYLFDRSIGTQRPWVDIATNPLLNPHHSQPKLVNLSNEKKEPATGNPGSMSGGTVHHDYGAKGEVRDRSVPSAPLAKATSTNSLLLISTDVGGKVPNTAAPTTAEGGGIDSRVCTPDSSLVELIQPKNRIITLKPPPIENHSYIPDGITMLWHFMSLSKYARQDYKSELRLRLAKEMFERAEAEKHASPTAYVRPPQRLFGPLLCSRCARDIAQSSRDTKESVSGPFSDSSDDDDDDDDSSADSHSSDASDDNRHHRNRRHRTRHHRHHNRHHRSRHHHNRRHGRHGLPSRRFTYHEGNSTPFHAENPSHPERDSSNGSQQPGVRVHADEAQGVCDADGLSVHANVTDAMTPNNTHGANTAGARSSGASGIGVTKDVQRVSVLRDSELGASAGEGAHSGRSASSVAVAASGGGHGTKMNGSRISARANYNAIADAEGGGGDGTCVSSQELDADSRRSRNHGEDPPGDSSHDRHASPHYSQHADASPLYSQHALPETGPRSSDGGYGNGKEESRHPARSGYSGAEVSLSVEEDTSPRAGDFGCDGGGPRAAHTESSPCSSAVHQSQGCDGGAPQAHTENSSVGSVVQQFQGSVDAPVAEGCVEDRDVLGDASGQPKMGGCVGSDSRADAGRSDMVHNAGEKRFPEPSASVGNSIQTTHVPSSHLSNEAQLLGGMEIPQNVGDNVPVQMSQAVQKSGSLHAKSSSAAVLRMKAAGVEEADAAAAVTRSGRAKSKSTNNTRRGDKKPSPSASAASSPAKSDAPDMVSSEKVSTSTENESKETSEGKEPRRGGDGRYRSVSLNLKQGSPRLARHRSLTEEKKGEALESGVVGPRSTFPSAAQASSQGPPNPSAAGESTAQPISNALWERLSQTVAGRSHKRTYRDSRIDLNDHWEPYLSAGQKGDPRIKPESGVFKMIHQVYLHKIESDGQDEEARRKGLAQHVVDFMKMKYGLKPLVGMQLRDLLASLAVPSIHAHKSVETFSRLLGLFGPVAVETLQFFLGLYECLSRCDPTFRGDEKSQQKNPSHMRRHVIPLRLALRIVDDVAAPVLAATWLPEGRLVAEDVVAAKDGDAEDAVEVHHLLSLLVVRFDTIFFKEEKNLREIFHKYAEKSEATDVARLPFKLLCRMVNEATSDLWDVERMDAFYSACLEASGEPKASGVTEGGFLEGAREVGFLGLRRSRLVDMRDAGAEAAARWHSMDDGDEDDEGGPSAELRARASVASSPRKI
eukprot:Rmarinus@m.4947